MLDAALTRIYLLVDPRDGSWRYVGKTVQTLERRLASHLAPSALSKHNKRAWWMKAVLAEGLKPVPVLLEEVQGDGCAEEQTWIAVLREAGYPLLNMTEGGDGVLGRVQSEAERAHRRTLDHSAQVAAMAEANRTRPWSEEQRAAISSRFKGKQLSKEHKQKIASALRGRAISEETRLRQSEAAKRQWARRRMESA